MSAKTYVFDLDGTLCEERKTFEKSLAAPKLDIIEIVNRLYRAGHTIIIYTARGWMEYKMTEHWLKTHNVNYNVLMCGKPVYDVWIDDRALNVLDINKLGEAK